MLGMSSQMGLERLKELDCHSGDSLTVVSALENGKMTQLEDCEVVGVGGTKGAALCPITPIPCWKNGESVSVVSSPLSTESSASLNGECAFDCTSSGDVVGSGLEDSPRTPKEGVFNPFAPGPEEMCLAPLGKRAVKENRRIARRLNFEDVDECRGDEEEDAEVQSEKVLLDNVYGTLLEAIILKQTEDFLAENQSLELEGCSTPTSLPRLTGIAETCPGAPSKAVARKPLNIDQGLCKKLEFG